MKTEKNIRKGFGLAGKIAMFCIGLVSLVLTSCESELEIQQSYPFTYTGIITEWLSVSYPPS